MAISFPISLAGLADLFPAKHFAMDLQENQNVTGLASGDPIAVNHMPMLWAGSAKSIKMYHVAAQELAAKFRTLDGATNQFNIYDVRKTHPANDLDGVIFGASTPIISVIGANNKSFSITGLPAGYILTAGDRFHATYSTSRRFYGEFSETVTANESGQIASIEVRPHLRPGFLAGGAITIIKPAIKAKLVPNSLKVNEVNTIMSTVSFAFQQTLAQD